VLTAVLDVDGRAVDLGARVALHPEGTPGELVEIQARYPRGGWRVVVQPDGASCQSVRGAHQIRGL